MSITSSIGQQQQYTYDADGNQLTSVEPSSLGSAATLTYGYYLNGWRESLAVSSHVLTQTSPPLFQYAYRSDGLQAWQQVNYSAGSLYMKNYTAAGRLASLEDPSGWKGFGYDALGQESSLNASFQNSSLTVDNYKYDAEGSLTQKIFENLSVVSNKYDIRGELVISASGTAR